MLGIDWGERRIGVAVSWSGLLADPHSVVINEGTEQSAERLRLICDEVEAELLVLGVPAGSRHDSPEIRAKFDSIAAHLRQKTCRPVELWDESYTTAAALSHRAASGQRRRRSDRTPIDSLAAAIILQSWIDAHETGEST